MKITKEAQERKNTPVYSGFIKYFPDAIIAVARNSWQGNQQHNPDKPLFWDRSKSKDELDALMRHLIDEARDPGGVDSDGIHHCTKVAWRAMGYAQKFHEQKKKRTNSR